MRLLRQQDRGSKMEAEPEPLAVITMPAVAADLADNAEAAGVEPLAAGAHGDNSDAADATEQTEADASMAVAEGEGKAEGKAEGAEAVAEGEGTAEGAGVVAEGEGKAESAEAVAKNEAEAEGSTAVPVPRAAAAEAEGREEGVEAAAAEGEAREEGVKAATAEANGAAGAAADDAVAKTETVEAAADAADQGNAQNARAAQSGSDARDAVAVAAAAAAAAADGSVPTLGISRLRGSAAEIGGRIPPATTDMATQQTSIRLTAFLESVAELSKADATRVAPLMRRPVTAPAGMYGGRSLGLSRAELKAPARPKTSVGRGRRPNHRGDPVINKPVYPMSSTMTAHREFPRRESTCNVDYCSAVCHNVHATACARTCTRV